MIEQLKTIQENAERIAHNSTDDPRSCGYAILTALTQLEAMVGAQEPVAEAESLRLAGLTLIGLAEHDQHCEVFDLDDEGKHRACTCGLDGAIATITQAGKTAAPVAQQQGEVVVTWDEQRTRILAVTRQDREGRILKVIAEAPAQHPQAECAHRWAGSYAVPDDARCVDCGAWRKQPQAEVVPQDVGQLEYRGNSVAYIHQKMTAYRGAIDAAWQAMRDAGHPPDGCTPLAQAITKALAPQQAEAVPSDVVRDAVAAEREACAALAQGYAGQVGDVAWAVAAAIRGRGNAAIAQQKGGV